LRDLWSIGIGFRVCGIEVLKSRVEGSWFSSRFRVDNSNFRALCKWLRVQGSGCGVAGKGFGVKG